MKYFHINTFTDRIFKGNPAIVCVLAEWFSDHKLQQIARENNLATTAFIKHVKENEYHIRWFTPEMEFYLCGHGTLAAAFVINNYLQKESLDNVVLNTQRHGKITVDIQGDDKFEMAFKAIALEETTERLDEIFHEAPSEIYKTDRYIAVLNDEQDVINFNPNFSAIKKLNATGLVITATGNNCDFVSRYFAPSIGINEDQATGSAHCMLTPYWAKRLGKTNLFAKQLSPRGGELECKLDSNQVKISGQAVLYAQGKICI